jgi:hypothetical protein
MSGQDEHRFGITAISKANPCKVTVDAVHGYSTNDLVRLTDLNGSIPVDRGMPQINNDRWEIVVTSTTQFTLRDPVTHEDVDSTNFTTYVTGGSCNRIETNFQYEE